MRKEYQLDFSNFQGVNEYIADDYESSVSQSSGIIARDDPQKERHERRIL
jgi:hypothetical protein